NENCAGTVKAESLSSCQMKITISGIKIPGDYQLRVDHADGKVRRYTLTLPEDNEFVIPLGPTMVDLGSGQYGHEIYLRKIMPEGSSGESLSTTYVSEHDNEWIENNCGAFDAEYSQCRVTATVFDAVSGKYRVDVLNESSDGLLWVVDRSKDFDWVAGGEAKTMSFRLRENLVSDKLVVRLVDAVTNGSMYEKVIEQEGLQNSVKQCLPGFTVERDGCVLKLTADKLDAGKHPEFVFDITDEGQDLGRKHFAYPTDTDGKTSHTVE
ncbi:MAG: hypothetical protein Q4P05_05935, partial [Actinomycetaceae bacterium]|nr:hypothetical protein [Actinomycetaceae bacterium]